MKPLEKFVYDNIVDGDTAQELCWRIGDGSPEQNTCVGFILTSLGKAGLIDADAQRIYKKGSGFLDLAKQVCDAFNVHLESNYRRKTFETLLKPIFRANPSVTLTNFESIILHKKDKWMGTDMEQYLRPATLFGSVKKFELYLDDATNYWIKKRKEYEQGKNVQA